ncbi:hypothetical protein CTAYLR_001834 [Chrysophaeum taylorii]|uniref:proline--tRNA ligase n=1 Tax=Chrysophaeum taylorii TaxID=2483200 RepID=A0AAD7U8X0_9STRA|nr:hypothetical protein CTAYLR_001834 [Chrysophaeum taylorii]
MASLLLRVLIGRFAVVVMGFEVAPAIRRRHVVRTRKASSSSSSSSPPVAKKRVADKTKTSFSSSSSSSSITPAGTDFSQWYLDVIQAADLVDQSPVKGCMVIKPWGMSIWERLRGELDAEITARGAENAYFPLFIPQSFLSREADHVDGFAKECAVVTHHRLLATETGVVPDPDAKLEEPLVVRPTSETIIWHMFRKWINSYRDLPLKVNQWANVVRWEMRTRPFLRSAEFLWQEGHTAHATAEEAIATAEEMLDVYARVVERTLAVPVVKGAKSASERFAGADETLTIEALMPNGWALQSGTSHFLGQNFARAFDVYFQTKEGARDLVWATSWGASTRLLGALVMTHSDDAGLVLPPNVAPVQVVVVPIRTKKPDETRLVDEAIDEILRALRGIRVKVDDRDNLRPGPKFFEWEKKGVPLRIEIGPRDVAAGTCVLAPRSSGGKKKEALDLDRISEEIPARLEAIQRALLADARRKLDANTRRVDAYDEMRALLLEDRSPGGFFVAPWCDDADNEDKIKADCKATIRCYPTDLQAQVHEGNPLACFYSGRPATHIAIFARAF